MSYDDQVPVPFRPVDEDYDIAFGTDDETEQIIVDTAVDTARNNATGDNADIITEEDEAMDYTMKNVQDAVDAGDIKNKEDARKLGVPESIISGLSFALAGKAKLGKPDSVADQLFPEDSDIEPFGQSDRMSAGLQFEDTKPANFLDPSIPEKDLRPRYKEAPEEEGIAGDLPIEDTEPVPLFDDSLSGLAKAPAPTVDNLKSLNIVDDKGEALNVENPAKFQSQLKSMYDKVFRKGARSRLSKEEYTRLNKELIRMISTGSGIEPDVTNRMTKIIPREIEMFLKSKKRDKDSIVRALQENIRWAN